MRGGVSVVADLERNDRAAISHEDRIGFVVHYRESGCNDGDGKMFGRSTAKAGNSGKINNGTILHIGGDIDGAKGRDIDSIAGSDGAETAFGLQYQDITIVGRQGDEAFRGILIAEVGEGEIERENAVGGSDGGRLNPCNLNEGSIVYYDLKRTENRLAILCPYGQFVSVGKQG